MSKRFMTFILALLMVITALPSVVQAEEDLNAEISIEEVGAVESEVNSAVEEETSIITRRGMLIEIGNTTAEQTTIIIRVTNTDGSTEDVTLEINSDTKIVTNNNRSADLSDWIAGDQISFTAEEYENSNQLVATLVRNHSFKYNHIGRNGWIKAIRVDKNEMDVEWAGKIYTLDTTKARMVAGLKNPATLDDFEIGDRVRGRVVEDGDGNNLTWDAQIIVVLRRGNDLFMRVTRWVVPGKIVAMPDDLTLPVTIDVEVLNSRFYEKGDVNNLVGAPGTIIQVDVTEDTKLVRRFLGKTNLKEFSEGDVIRVIGRRDENTDHLVAKVIKNNNIQRLGVANKVGRVISVDSAANIVKVNLVRPNTGKVYTVVVDNDTIIMKLGQEINLVDIAVDDLIRVRGTFRRSTNTVDADKISVIVSRDEIPEDIGDIRELRSRFRIRTVEKVKSRIKKFFTGKNDSILGDIDSIEVDEIIDNN